MGLTTWKDSPDGKILKRDIGIAKNYLNEKELYTQSKKGNIKIELTKKEEEFSRIVNDIFKETFIERRLLTVCVPEHN